MASRKKLNTRQFILNCNKSEGTATDWTMSDAADAGLISLRRRVPASKDLRARWWKIDDQGQWQDAVTFGAHHLATDHVAVALFSPRAVGRDGRPFQRIARDR